MLKSKMTRNQKASLIMMFLIALCLWSFVTVLSIPVAPPAPKTPPTALPSPTPLQHKKFMAQIKCQRFIEDKLISPLSAKFSNEKSYTVNDMPLNYHAVTGIVESQNRLGVLLRLQYRCDTHYLPNDPGTWVLDYLDFED